MNGLPRNYLAVEKLMTIAAVATVNCEVTKWNQFDSTQSQ